MRYLFEISKWSRSFPKYFSLWLFLVIVESQGRKSRMIWSFYTNFKDVVELKNWTPHFAYIKICTVKSTYLNPRRNRSHDPVSCALCVYRSLWYSRLKNHFLFYFKQEINQKNIRTNFIMQMVKYFLFTYIHHNDYFSFLCCLKPVTLNSIQKQIINIV